MNKIFVDTAFIVALVNTNDQYHDIALELSKVYENALLLTTDVVMLEIGNALAKKHKADAITIIEALRSSKEVEIVNLTPQLFERAFEMFKKYVDKQWGLVDCISFIAMKDNGVVDALTCDNHFSQAGFNILMHKK